MRDDAKKKTAPDVAAAEAMNIESTLPIKHSVTGASISDYCRDGEILSLQFLAECGGGLARAGVALTSAAMGERVDVVEASIRVARNIVVEAVRELKTMRGEQ